jgi:hypothetical protein
MQIRNGIVASGLLREIDGMTLPPRTLEYKRVLRWVVEQSDVSNTLGAVSFHRRWLLTSPRPSEP